MGHDAPPPTPPMCPCGSMTTAAPGLPTRRKSTTECMRTVVDDMHNTPWTIRRNQEAEALGWPTPVHPRLPTDGDEKSIIARLRNIAYRLTLHASEPAMLNCDPTALNQHQASVGWEQVMEAFRQNAEYLPAPMDPEKVIQHIELVVESV